jgi:hypothetical protein
MFRGNGLAHVIALVLAAVVIHFFCVYTRCNIYGHRLSSFGHASSVVTQRIVKSNVSETRVGNTTAGLRRLKTVRLLCRRHRLAAARQWRRSVQCMKICFSGAIRQKSSKISKFDCLSFYLLSITLQSQNWRSPAASSFTY